MPLIRRVTELFLLAAVFFFSHPDAAMAQQLLLNQNPVVLSISGQGGTTSTQVSLSSPLSVTSLTVPVGGVTTVPGSGSWLCASASGTTLTISVGSLCSGGSTTQLLNNQQYNGSIQVTGNPGNLSTNLSVILQVGNSSTNANGLVANPNPVTFSAASGGGSQSSSVNVTYNGAPAAITNVTTSGQAWLQAFSTFAGALTVTVNPFNAAAGLNTGTIFVTTPNGSINFPVNLTVGSTNANGLAATPNPLTFNLTTGSISQSQNVNITYNGAATALTSTPSYSTNTGQGWLQVASTGTTGLVMVTVNPAFLVGTSDTGNVFVQTVYGQASFQVILSVGNGTTSGLAVSPNILSLSLPFGSGQSTQNVNVTYNSGVTTVTSVNAITTTGQGWLLPTISGATGSVTITVTPSILAVGSYSGTVYIYTNFGQVTLPVNLSVGTGGTTGFVATPSTVNFNIPLVGSGAPPQTVNITSNGVPVSITNITTTGQIWLLASAGITGSVNVSVNAANLGAGTYSATITVTTSAGTLTLPVNLTVGGGGGSTTGLSATPNPVFLTVPVGGASTAQNVTINYNGTPTTVQNVSATTTTGQSWLQAFSGTTLGSVTVNANPAFLTAGSYTGNVTVATAFGQANFQVNLTVGSGGGTSGLAVTPNPMNFTAGVNGGVSSQNATVALNGSPVTISSITSATSTGQSWLLPSFSSGIPGTITVSVNPSILSAGSYSGTVTVNTVSGQTTFQVNLTVGSGGSTNGLTANPSTVTFTEASAGQAAPQTISATLNGVTVPISSTTFVNTPILSPTFVNTQVNADGTVTLTVNGVVTTPGFYQGTLTIYAGANSVGVPVSLTFGSGGSTSGLSINPSPVSFSVQPGGSSQSQNVNVTFNGFPVVITGLTTSTSTGQTWLQASSATGVTGSITVTANPVGLPAGTFLNRYRYHRLGNVILPGQPERRQCDHRVDHHAHPGRAIAGQFPGRRR